jgi:hypothetical protein
MCADMATALHRDRGRRDNGRIDANNDFVLPRHMEWANGHGIETLPASMAWAL